MRKDNVLTVFIMSSCPNCPAAKKLCEKVCKKLRITLRIVDIKEDLVEALMFQVMETPSIAINNDTIFFAIIPTEEDLIKKIKMYID